MAITKKQGDSLWLDITGDAMGTVDSVWANWTGLWAIVAVLGNTPLLSGSLTKDADVIGKFYLRVGSTQMSTLPVGNYIIACQVQNTTVDYVQEIVQEKLKITAQGIA